MFKNKINNACKIIQSYPKPWLRNVRSASEARSASEGGGRLRQGTGGAVQGETAKRSAGEETETRRGVALRLDSIERRLLQIKDQASTGGTIEGVFNDDNEHDGTETERMERLERLLTKIEREISNQHDRD